MFYNVENLFDTIDDPDFEDDEYTPKGDRRWNGYKYYRKINNIYKAITLSSIEKHPDIIILAEIENKTVINNLIYKSPLFKNNYGVIHYESKDRRGIDQAFLYKKAKFTPLMDSTISIKFPQDPSLKTRDILYVKGLLPNRDTLHLIAVHYPSKYSGIAITNKRRQIVSSYLTTLIQKISESNPNPNLIITGDFNCTTEEKALKDLVINSNIKIIVNPKDKSDIDGSYKYRGLWSRIDHFLVSDNVYIKTYFSKICNPKALLEADETYFGLKPKRTFYGYKYLGGYSDHLPILIEMKL
jgi:exonuclease III